MKDAERIAELEAALRRADALVEQLQSQLRLRGRALLASQPQASAAQGQQVECQECGRLRGDFEELAERYGKLQAGEDSLTGDYIARCQRLADELAITRRVIDRIGQLCTTPHESKERFIRRVQSVIEWEAQAISAKASP